MLQYDSELADEIISDHELINFKNDNDKIDMHLINEVFLGKVDYMITQDRKLIDKAKKLNIQNKVLTIEQFIELQLSLSHDLPSGELFIDKVKIGSLNFKDVFFNSLREAYNYTEKMEFDIWLTKKSNNFAYVYKDSLGKIQGFLYLKEEKSGTEKYDIVPSFNDCNRLKIGTFKVNSTGFRLGERFMKIIFDTALS
ncbi:hypothetical protein FACS189459_2330 [Bacilli bacterium]|nr:hypothetical protein FACS189459_2330 [Bacilli bacterium]